MSSDNDALLDHSHRVMKRFGFHSVLLNPQHEEVAIYKFDYDVELDAVRAALDDKPVTEKPA
jgi:hypothetical protein